MMMTLKTGVSLNLQYDNHTKRQSSSTPDPTDILATLAAICVFTDEEGWVGAGVWIEVHNALARELPVYLLTANRVYPWARVEVIEPETRNYRRYVQFHPTSSAAGNGHG